MSIAGGDPIPARAPYTCPSAPATPGAGLLGVLGPDGQIHNLRTPMQVGADFLNAAKAAGPPEARMRFTGTCQTSGSAQWTATRCGVIDRAMATLKPPPRTELPHSPLHLRADHHRHTDRDGIDPNNPAKLYLKFSSPSAQPSRSSFTLA